ncbi:MAG: hypothetical protein ACREVX_02395 [Clostridium sp.]|uniref:hypothetical protein n=1 Tax=Clostridium sp. TaxID=1506 RepID=UPI003D6D15BF
MSGVSQLSGCSWHVEKLQKKDERRHNHNCMYFSNYNKCNTLKSAYYNLRCGGSAQCKSYKKICEGGQIRKSTNKNTDSKKDDESYWFD